MRADARAVAHQVLVRVETTDAFADVLLADRLARAPMSAVDHALATRLVYGTLAWQGRLDHHLKGLVRMPLADLDPPVRAALRLGLYQLLFLDRVPAYAAVHASVGLARAAAGAGAAGLVNAVLRRAAGAGVGGLPLPHPAADPLERLAIEWSHPRWLVERWAAELGRDELPRLLAANNVRGPSAVRANRLRTSRDALRAELAAARVAARPSVWAPDGLVIEDGAAGLRALPAWREGRLAFQGEASQLVVRRVRDEAVRLGAACVEAAVGDARRPPFVRPFDAVLVDAPCSGLGTLRRHPELRWRRRAEDIARLAALQREILAGAAPLVRPGGVLVYAVCTLAREENEDVVEWFRTRHPAFVLEGPALSPDLVTPTGYLRTLPHRHDLDGFFAARLRLDSRASLR